MAASWIERLKGYDIDPSIRLLALEVLLLSLAQIVDGHVVKDEWMADSFVGQA